MDKGRHNNVPVIALEGDDPRAADRIARMLRRDGRWDVCLSGELEEVAPAVRVLHTLRDWQGSLKRQAMANLSVPCILGLPQKRLALEYAQAIEAGATYVVPSDSEESFAGSVVSLLTRILESSMPGINGSHSDCRLNLPCAVAHINEQGQVTIWNDSAELLFAHPLSQALGQGIDPLLNTRRPILPQLGGPDPQPQGETPILRGTGDEITCQWRASRCHGGWALVFDDITNRVQAEAELREAIRATDAANRAKSEFLAVMSHEIRTPMNSIIGFTELLLDQELTERQRDYLDIVRNNGISLLELINNVLEFSRIESGRVESDAAEADLRQIVVGVVDSLWVSASRKGIDLFARISDEVPRRVVLVQGELRRILLNLASNGIKFTDRGSVQINVSLMQVGDRHDVLFKVIDTGIGIPEDKADLLFKSFSQIDSSSTRRYGGTGLGLAISKRLCESMGGRMWMTSILGKGSTFYFTVPLQVSDPREAPVVSPMAGGTEFQPPPRDVRLKILVAEDEPMNQLLVQRFLSKLGHECTLANNGSLAIERMREEEYNLVLMDVQMPHMDGLQAAREIRGGAAGRTHRDVYICALTAYAMAGDQERCINAGMDDYVSKPIAIGALRNVIGRATNRMLLRLD